MGGPESVIVSNLEEPIQGDDVPYTVTEVVTDNTVSANMEDLDDRIRSLMEDGDANFGGKHGKVCKVCGKQDKQSNIKQHIEANHITGVTHTCAICGKSSRSR